MTTDKSLIISTCRQAWLYKFIDTIVGYEYQNLHRSDNQVLIFISFEKR